MANYELVAIAAELDWINVMTYDFRGAWDITLTAHHSPLRPNPADPVSNPNIRDRYNADWAMSAWSAAGVPRDKLVMGVPFYGRAWGGVPPTNNGLFQPGTHVPAGTWDDWASGATGVNEFWEIQTLEANPAYAKHWDSFSKVPFLYSPTTEGGHFIGYDDAESIAMKVGYVNRRGYGGIMVWELSADRNQTLIDVIDRDLWR